MPDRANQTVKCGCPSRSRKPWTAYGLPSQRGSMYALARCRVVGCVPIRGIGEDIAGVVGNDVENDVDSLLVCGLNKVAKLFSCPEVRIHVEKVLNSVTVIARLERHLSENRADPKGSDAETPQVAEFAFQAPERAALPAAAGTEPNIVVDSTGVFRGVERRGSGACRASIVVSEAPCSFPSENRSRSRK